MGDKTAKDFIAANGLTMPFMKDVNTEATFNIASTPRTIFFDRNGKIVSDKKGKLSLEAFEAELKKIL